MDACTYDVLSNAVQCISVDVCVGVSVGNCVPFVQLYLTPRRARRNVRTVEPN